VATETGPVAQEEAVEQALHAAAEAVARDATTISGAIADVLVREIDVVPGDAQTRADVLRRAEAQISVIVDDFRRGIEPAATVPPPEALAYARVLARRAVPLDVFLRIHRLGFAELLRAWQDRLDAAGDADVLLAATRRSTEHLFAHQDVLLGHLSAEYERERERFVRSADALRRETIQAILASEPVDLDRAGAVLGYDVRRHHVGLVLWAEPTADEPAVAPRLERAAAGAAQRLGGGRPLLLSEGTATMWAWVGLDAEPAADLVDALVARPMGDRVSIAVGEPARGVAGFRRTHRDAADAARVARLAERRAGSIVAYRSVQLEALLSGDLERARRFVAEQLGPLGREDDEMARLRATLTSYLEENGSRVATARRLGIHPNTVANRVRTCRELLGRDPTRHQVRLQVALGLAAGLGPAVLRDVAPPQR
jgi:DNA-binding PucR family transcriptional regulator